MPTGLPLPDDRPGPDDHPGRPHGPLSDGLRMAVGTLTALPVPAPSRIDRRVAAVAMLLAPVAGLIPAVVTAAVAALADVSGSSAPLAAALAVGTLALATRGLHLDGLADTADGLTAGYERSRALDVMRRGDTGPAGAAALVLVLLVQTTALAQALDRHGPVAVVVTVVVGRSALMLGCLRGIPAARPEGLGATVAGAVPRVGAGLGFAVVAAAAWAVTGPAGPLAVVAAMGTTGVLLSHVVRRLGGITGDVLGACVELATATSAVALALSPGAPLP
jgi:adenosylcobinamide-GDP ribazoletransferase